MHAHVSVCYKLNFSASQSLTVHLICVAILFKLWLFLEPVFSMG